jgi:hypothetical protein
VHGAGSVIDWSGKMSNAYTKNVLHEYKKGKLLMQLLFTAKAFSPSESRSGGIGGLVALPEK